MNPQKKKKKELEKNEIIQQQKNIIKIIIKMFKCAIERFWFYKKIGFLFKIVIVVSSWRSLQN